MVGGDFKEGWESGKGWWKKGLMWVVGEGGGLFG